LCWQPFFLRPIFCKRFVCVVQVLNWLPGVLIFAKACPFDQKLLLTLADSIRTNCFNNPFFLTLNDYGVIWWLLTFTAMVKLQ
jgi:hypothetical protein